MPLYEYECGSCGHRFERIQKFSDPPERVCPKCGGEVHKLMAAPAVQFKGSGWYVTDYAGKGKEKKEKKGAEATEGTKATEKSADAKESKDTKEPKETKETKATDSPKKDSKGA